MLAGEMDRTFGAAFGAAEGGELADRPDRITAADVGIEKRALMISLSFGLRK